MGRKKEKSIQKVYQFEIRGEKWTARVLSSKYFDKLHSDSTDANALCWKEKRLIDFRKLTLHIVRHELFHAYYSTLFLDDTDVRASDIEEMLANFLPTYAQEYLKKSREIYSALKK